MFFNVFLVLHVSAFFKFFDVLVSSQCFWRLFSIIYRINHLIIALKYVFNCCYKFVFFMYYLFM